MTHCTTLAIHHTALHHASAVLREAYDAYEHSGSGVEECEVAWQSFVEARDAYTAFIEEVVEVEGVSVKTLTRRGAMLVERVREVVPGVIFLWVDHEMMNANFEYTQASPEHLYVAISLLPDTVAQLCCSNIPLTALPKLPNGLTEFYCYDTPLTALPELPNGLTYLNCFDTKLTTLPKLPDGLMYLNCCDTKLTALPELPDRLTHLDCHETKLTSLPKLPDGLTKIFCSETNITTLPELPDSLAYLDCRDTPASKNPEVIKRIGVFKRIHPSIRIIT